MKLIARFFLLIAAVACLAAQGPRHKSLRAFAMGNAHVAISDDKEAIYYNYAGLSQMGKLGSYEKFPETGYYPGNGFDMRLNVGGAGKLNNIRKAYRVGMDVEDLYNRARDATKNSDVSTDRAFTDSLVAHPELIRRINKFDHALFTIIAKADAELAFHNFGGSLWIDGTMSPFVDGGILIPFFGVDTFYIDAVAQMGGAYGITDNLAVGAGIKFAKRQNVETFRLDASNFRSFSDTLDDRLDETLSDFFGWNGVGIGMDLGVLYQAGREVRLGASCNNIFFTELGGERILPNLTLGMAYSPRFLNRNTAFSRKVNFAIDFENALSTERNYKTLSHLDFGMEIEQVLLAVPGYNDNWRILKLRLSGGFRGGYPSAGIALEMLRFVEVEVATWSEELGYYTGQRENRIYMAQLSLGF